MVIAAAKLLKAGCVSLSRPTVARIAGRWTDRRNLQAPANGPHIQAVIALEEILGHGLNAATGEYGDLFAQGIIDPAKVTRSALQNAASIAGLFLTTEVVVADKPEKAAAPAGDPTGGMDF